ncbi:MAG: hypothetical protein ACTH6I_12830 [Vibrio litoralis]|uniref:hypothetical protein n=1 Tax=Vibrio litoralis TaxID=335972 RepID=UPI003F964D90
MARSCPYSFQPNLTVTPLPKVVWRNQPHPRFPLCRLLLPSVIIYQGEELIFAAFTLMFTMVNRML